MKKNSTILFCDESGSTGANLLDADQPYFVYSSVNIEEGLACQYLEALRKKIGYQAPEFKAKNLLRSDISRKELLILLEKISPNIKFVFVKKNLALAAKFFEYVFEPCLQEQNIPFYDNNFHLFITLVLYKSFQENQVIAVSFFENFLNNMKLKTQNIELFFNVDSKDKLDPVLKQIQEFVLLNQSTIRQEFEDSSISTNKWRLDLTDTSLCALLHNWHLATEGCSLEVYCDESDPLQDNGFAKVFENFDSVEGYLLPSFKLSKPIIFVKSEDYKGIQLADLVSGAVAYALKNKDEYADEIKKILFKPNICCWGRCIDEEFMYISKNQEKANFLVLNEIVRRSKNSESLTDGIFDLYQSFNWLIKHTA